MCFSLYPVSQIRQKTAKKQDFPVRFPAVAALIRKKGELPPPASPAVGDSSLLFFRKKIYFFVAYWKKKYPREVNPTLSTLASLQYSCV